MFTVYDKKQINQMLEKAQLYLQPFRTQTDELQALWQEIVLTQVHLDRIKVEDEVSVKDIIRREARVLGD